METNKSGPCQNPQNPLTFRPGTRQSLPDPYKVELTHSSMTLGRNRVCRTLDIGLTPLGACEDYTHLLPVVLTGLSPVRPVFHTGSSLYRIACPTPLQ